MKIRRDKKWYSFYSYWNARWVSQTQQSLFSIDFDILFYRLPIVDIPFYRIFFTSIIFSQKVLFCSKIQIKVDDICFILYINLCLLLFASRYKWLRLSVSHHICLKPLLSLRHFLDMHTPALILTWKLYPNEVKMRTSLSCLLQNTFGSIIDLITFRKRFNSKF